MSEKPSIDFGGRAGVKLRPGKGLDVGTANLLSAVQDYEGNVIIKQQRNAFLDIEQNDFTRNMLTKMDVQYVILNNRMIVIGDPAFDPRKLTSNRSGVNSSSGERAKIFSKPKSNPPFPQTP